MKSLIISFGGDKAAEIVDILSYYTRHAPQGYYLQVDVVDTKGRPIPDAVVDTREAPAHLESSASLGAVDVEIFVEKQKHQSIRERVTLKKGSTYQYRAALADEEVQPVLISALLILAAPFVWASMMYLLGWISVTQPLQIYLDLAVYFFIFELIGIYLTRRFLKDRLKRLFTSIDGRYMDFMALLTGAYFGVIVVTSVLYTLLPGLFQDVAWGSVMSIAIIIAGLGIVGLIVDLYAGGLRRWHLDVSLTIGLGALAGGYVVFYILHKAGSAIGSVNLLEGNTGIVLLLPVLIAAGSVIGTYAIEYLLKQWKGGHPGILGNRDIFRGFLTLCISLGVTALACYLGGLLNTGTFILLAAGILAGGFIGLTWCLKFSRKTETSRLECESEDKIPTKRYRLNLDTVIIDDMKTRFDRLRYVPSAYHLMWEKCSQDGELSSSRKKQVLSKINTIIEETLQECSRLFSCIIVICDLRNNEICADLQPTIALLKKEYSLPVYAIILSGSEKEGMIDPDWINGIATESDAVIPVDCNLFPDIRRMDSFVTEDVDGVTIKDHYDQTCVIEIIRRLAPILETGQRDSPSGLDVSHILRLFQKQPLRHLHCMDTMDIFPEVSRNIASLGYFRLNADKCGQKNFEVAMGEYVLYAMKNLLWNFSEMPDTSRCLAILRGRPGMLKTGAVNFAVNDVYPGIPLIVGELIDETSPDLELIVALSHVATDTCDIDGFFGKDSIVKGQELKISSTGEDTSDQPGNISLAGDPEAPLDPAVRSLIRGFRGTS